MTTGIESTSATSSRILVGGAEAFSFGAGGIVGTVVKRAYAEYTANAALATAIPLDDSIPQNTEGTQILSISHTPRSTTNIIRLRFTGIFSVNAGVGIAAVFSSASANALRAAVTSVTAGDTRHPFVMEVEHVPGVTTALTYSVRVGANAGNTLRMNGYSAGRELGGAMGAVLILEEIAP